MSLYEHLAVIAPGLSLPRRAALVATARSIGVETSVDSEIDEIRSELRSLPKPVPSRADARQRVAEAEAALDAERERVATIRGRMQESDDTLEAEYRAAIRTLSEAETEHAAAVEALNSARDRARTARDTRDRRLRLEDRLENLRRRARRELVGSVRPAVDDAVSAVPDADAGAFDDADPIPAALALVRVGRIDRPVVLACRRFRDREAAERWLGAPAYRL